MSTTITIELCAEDRARLDRLAEALERKACEKCVSTTLEVCGKSQPAEAPESASTPTEATETPLNEEEAEVVQTADPVAETPAEGEPTHSAEEVKPTLTKDQLQQKITQLAAAKNGALKAKVRGIVKAYAEKVSDLPEDKFAEIWDKLLALEAEVTA